MIPTLLTATSVFIIAFIAAPPVDIDQTLTLCARNLESLKILHLGLFSLSSLATIPFDPYIKA
jgi:hypothetical protein